MIPRFYLLVLPAVLVGFGLGLGGLKWLQAEKAARQVAHQDDQLTTASGPMVLALADEQAIDLLSMAVLHWQICEGGGPGSEGRLVTTARTLAARRLDPDDPRLERAVGAAISRYQAAIEAQGSAQWCGMARARLDRQLG